MKSSRLFIEITLLAFLSLLSVSTLNAHAFQFSSKVCKEYNLGSNWYCEAEKENKGEELTSPGEIMERDVAPEQKAILLNQLWDTQQKRAVITGKKEDLENVLVTQRYIAKLGTDFAKKMVRITESNPAYSNTESYYQSVSNEYIDDAKQNQVLKTARHRFAIAFIYASNCPYCKRQLPILHLLKETTGIALIGISVDGSTYPGLDDNIKDPEAANDPNIKAYPTIMLLDAKTEQRLFISKGLTTKDQLEKLIYKKILEVENTNA